MSMFRLSKGPSAVLKYWQVSSMPVDFCATNYPLASNCVSFRACGSIGTLRLKTQTTSNDYWQIYARMNHLQKKIKSRIQAAHRVLVTSHVRPDGDAIGSSLALSLALIDAGKQVQVVLADGLPDGFKYLPGAELVRTRAEGDFDLIISVDCSDLQRIGSALDGYRAPDIIIDHHVTTEDFGTLNLVEPAAVA